MVSHPIRKSLWPRLDKVAAPPVETLIVDAKVNPVNASEINA